ncbi:ABC transporter ATP-binding protein [Halobacteriales archaeon QS_1_67_19]|nr:MAG: ABC transporter ATP-binding protein [Halobacteriales archaeon QS_1_67_19]
MGRSDDPLVELDDVTKEYDGTTAVSGISLRVERGELFTLVGPSGCGKTTTLRLVSGFERPTSGTVRIDGRDATDVAPEDRDTNLVFQDHALFPHMTVAENAGYGLAKAGLDDEAREQKVEQLLSLMDLAGYGDRSPADLSGGQQQRVALARALANEPSVLLLDEPLASLDRKLRKQMQSELRRLHDAVAGSFFYVTHDQELAMAMSDRIAVMRDGEIAQVGTPEAVYHEPASPFVADFVGDTTLLDGRVELDDGRPRVALGDWARVPVETDVAGAATVSVRPEMVSLASDATDPNAFPATVRERTFRGESAQYRLAIDDEVTLTAKLPADADLDVGSTARFRIDAGEPAVFPA